MRIGILGGTFDPVHTGHLIAAVNARDELKLDKLLLVVTNQPWQKLGTREITPAAIRLEMVKAAVKGLSKIDACDIEIIRGGLSYTADTVLEVKAIHKSDKIYLLVGTDVAEELDTWERVEEFKEEVHLVIISRPKGHPDYTGLLGGQMAEEKLAANLLGWKASFLTIPALDVSSSVLRARVKDKKSLDFLVPKSVIDIIASNKLYC